MYTIKDWISESAAAELLNIERNTLRKYRERNQTVAALVPHERIANVWAWHAPTLLLYISEIRGHRITVAALDEAAKRAGNAVAWAEASEEVQRAAIIEARARSFFAHVGAQSRASA